MAPSTSPTPSVAHPPRLADHSADRRMVLLAAMAVAIGTGAAFAAWLLLHLIAFVTNMLWYGRMSVAPAEMADAAVGVMVLVIPVAGSLIVGLMARFGSDKIRGHGIPEAIEAILYGESRLSPKVALLKPLSSAISIGSGGPFGAEGPIIMTGGAIGSLIAQGFRLTAAERKTLLVAGAAAGMTAIFGSPAAAILLAIEVMLFEWKPRSFVPVVVAALTAIAWRPALIGTGALFPFAGAASAKAPVLALAIAFGLVAGTLAAALSTALYAIEDAFHRLPIHWMWWPALGSVVVGLGGLADPRVLGAGYANIQALLDGHWLAASLAVLLVAKAVVWLVALGSGTSGGVLAPLLILGGALGGLCGLWLPGHPGFWALLGMAGVMSAAMRAPLTSAMFAAEISGRFDALPAAIAASVAAYAIAVLVLRRSILTEKIARRGRHILQEYTVDPLALAQARDIMTPDPETLRADLPLHDTLAFFEAGARHRSYPVLDSAARPVGIASRADALRWRGSELDRDTPLGELVSDSAIPLVHPATPASDIAALMVREDVGRVCVTAPDSGRLIGIVARRNLLEPRAGLARAETERKGRWL